jgi:hypothetical protein
MKASNDDFAVYDRQGRMFFRWVRVRVRVQVGAGGWCGGGFPGQQGATSVLLTFPTSTGRNRQPTVQPTTAASTGSPPTSSP